MKWSKLKHLVEDRFADSVRGRVAIHSARYGACTCGRAWLAVDGEEVANFCTRAHGNVVRGELPPNPASLGKYKAGPVAYGELSRQDAYRACWAFVHDLSIEQALADKDPLVQTLAMLDARLGKRRLTAIDVSSLHPLAQQFHAFRVKAEGLATPPHYNAAANDS